MKTPNSALLFIDVQKGIDDANYWGGNRNNPKAEGNILTLLSLWRERKLPVIIVKHDSVMPQSPFRPGQPGNDFKELVSPLAGGLVLSKSTANAFINTALQKELDNRDIRELVITGFVTNNSVESTARMSGDLGYKTYVISDATACFNMRGINGITYPSELIHLISLSNLRNEYAQILNTKEVIKLLDESRKYKA